MTLDEIALREFGYYYNELGEAEKEWCRNELENSQ